MVDEAYIEMRCYVKFALHFGFSEEAIKNELIKSGWPLEKVKRAIMEVKGIKPIQKAVPQTPVQPVPAEMPPPAPQ